MHDRTRHDRRVALLLVIFVVTIDLSFYPHTLEDAFITLRFAKHMAQGHGPGAWNIDTPPVEGYTNLLWMLVLAAAHRAGLSMTAAAKALGLLAHVALCLVVLTRGRSVARDLAGTAGSQVAHVAAWLLAGYAPLAFYATSGMETVPFVLLTAVGLLSACASQAWLLASSSMIAVLMRPEGMIFGAAFGTLHLVRSRQPMALRLLPLVAAVVAFAGVTTWRLAIFGEWAPNTYFAKVSGALLFHLWHGVRYVGSWAVAHFAWLGLALAVVWSQRSRLRLRSLRTGDTMAFLVVFLAVYCLYQIRVGGDDTSAFPGWRHALHVLPLAVWLVAVGLVRLVPHRGLLIATVATMVAGNAPVLAMQSQVILHALQTSLEPGYPTLSDRPVNPFFVWLKTHSDEQTVIATAAAGELPYVIDAQHIDTLGLCDSQIAKNGTYDLSGPLDSKTNMGIVLTRQPDFIEAYFPASRVLKRNRRDEIVTYRKKMTGELLGNSIFRDHYEFVVNAPYAFFDRALFVRRDYRSPTSAPDRLVRLSLDQTSLYGEPGDRSDKSLENQP